MMVANTFVVFMFITVLIVTQSSWGFDLRNLYNSKVYKAERVTRPFRGFSREMGFISHSGVRVTLEDGTQWLVHKGKGFGTPSQTVVVDADHMSDRWRNRETKDFGGRRTVADLVKAGGSRYNLFNNCHSAARRMMKD